VTCESAGLTCGTVNDGCGNILTCGPSCDQCKPQKPVCNARNACQCFDDGCGGTPCCPAVGHGICNAP
jgi:hypothetical protein